MRPSDMDAIARVTAQQVKTIVDKKMADLQPPAPTVDHSDTIAAMQATIDALTEALEAKSGQIEAMVKAGEQMLDKIVELGKGLIVAKENADLQAASIEHLKKMDETRSNEIDDVTNTLGGYVKVEEFTEVCSQIGSIEKVLEVHAKGLDERLDEDRVVAQVHDAIMKELPDMVLHAIPEVKDGAPGKDAPPVDLDLLRGQVIDSLMKGIPDLIKSQMPPPREPTELQVLEGIKMMWPSIRHEMAKRLPKLEHRGTWDADTLYEVGDEVIKNGSTFRLMEASTDGPPSEAWQLIAQGRPGKQGKPGIGEKGDPGPAGVGVKDWLFEKDQIILQMTNGETAIFDFNLDDRIAEAVKQFMFDIKGDNDASS